MSAEVKNSLRALQFPLCVKEGLKYIEQLCNAAQLDRSLGGKQRDAAGELIDEFVFCETEWKNKRNKLNKLQELQLLEVLSDYFECLNNGNEASEAIRNAVFMSLFPHTLINRCSFLIKLVSVSITTSNIPLLTSVGVLLQQVGSTSQFTLELAKGLVRDYLILHSNFFDKLHDLPLKAPLFALNLICAFTEIYFEIDDGGISNEPNVAVLEIVNFWIMQNPYLCFTSFINDISPVLPVGAILMPPVTPYIGLFKWCIFSALFNSNNADLYCKLHAALLKSLSEIPNGCNPNQRNIIPSYQLTTMVRAYQNEYEKIKMDVDNEDQNTDSEYVTNTAELSLERLLQFLGCAFAINIIYGNKQELNNILLKLPNTRILQIVLARCQENINSGAF